MTLRVINPGMLATLQDLGRDGHGAIGVSRSGAADELSLRIGNRLVGNPDSHAAVECTLVGGAFAFLRGEQFVLAGAAVNATMKRADGSIQVVGAWQVIESRAADEISLGPMLGGARTYLCIAGGCEVSRVLGSRATQVSHAGGGVGGLPRGSAIAGNGSPLVPGDVLACGERVAAARTGLARGVREMCEEQLARRVVRVVQGPRGMPELDWQGRNLVLRVSTQWDRRGLRLTPALPGVQSGGMMLTEPMDYGFVQQTPSGELIILGPDAPPTGGYPVIATVASVDLPIVGQLRPGQEIRMEPITRAESWSAFNAFWRRIDAELPPV